MEQFDVVADPFPRSCERQPFRVSLQSDLLAQTLETTVVAPLEPADSANFARRLNPMLEIDGAPFALITQELVTVRTSVLGPIRTSAAEERHAIIDALDLLFRGF